MTLVGIVRKTAPSPLRCMKTLTRKRAMSPSSKEKSMSSFSWNTRRWRSFMMSNTMLCTSSRVRCACSRRFMSPWMRSMGGSPLAKCTSEAPSCTANVSSSVMSMSPPCQPLERKPCQRRGMQIRRRFRNLLGRLRCREGSLANFMAREQNLALGVGAGSAGFGTQQIRADRGGAEELGIGGPSLRFLAGDQAPGDKILQCHV